MSRVEINPDRISDGDEAWEDAWSRAIEHSVKLRKEWLKQVALGIDWDQQDASRYFIGEDVADLILMEIDFDFNEGICNKSIEKFCRPSVTASSLQDKK